MIDPARLWPFVTARSRVAYASHLRAIATELDTAPEAIVLELLGGPERARAMFAQWCGLPRVAELAAATRRARVASLRSILEHAGAPYNLPRVRLPPAARARYGLEPHEIGRMIVATRTILRPDAAARFEVLSRLGYEHGLRIGEICGLRDASVGASIRCVRKGGGVDDRPVGVLLGAAIQRWRELRPDVTEGHLLVTLEGATIGRAWAPRAARAHLAWVSVRTIGRRVPPHALRHAGMTEILRASGGNVRAAQLWARHASPQMSMRYDDDRTDPAGELAAALAATLAVPPVRALQQESQ